MPERFFNPKTLKAELPLTITIIEMATLELSKEKSAAVKRIKYENSGQQRKPAV